MAAHKKWPAVICCCCRAMAAPKKVTTTTTTAGMIIINNNETLSVSGPCGCNNSGSCNSYSNRMANSAACSMHHCTGYLFPLSTFLPLPPTGTFQPFPAALLLRLPIAPRHLRCRSCIHSYSATHSHPHTHTHTLTARLPGSFIDKQVLASLILGLRNASSIANKCRQRFA